MMKQKVYVLLINGLLVAQPKLAAAKPSISGIILP